jgi:hypothetical protein
MKEKGKIVDERSGNESSKDFITWDDLATQMFSEPVNNDLDRLSIQEAELWSTRWVVVIIGNCSGILFKPPPKLDESNAVVMEIDHDRSREEASP